MMEYAEYHDLRLPKAWRGGLHVNADTLSAGMSCGLGGHLGVGQTAGEIIWF